MTNLAMFIFYFFMPEFLDITYKKYGYGNNIVFFFSLY